MGEVARLLVLVIPFAAAGLLAFVADYRLGARLNATAAGAALLAAVGLLIFERPEVGIHFIVDDLNTVFVLLTAWSASRLRSFPPPTSPTNSRSAGSHPPSCASTTPCTRRCWEP